MSTSVVLRFCVAGLLVIAYFTIVRLLERGRR